MVAGQAFRSWPALTKINHYTQYLCILKKQLKFGRTLKSQAVTGLDPESSLDGSAPTPASQDAASAASAASAGPELPQIPEVVARPKPHRLGIGGEAALKDVPLAARPSLYRFLDFVELQGLSERSVESYISKLRQLASWAQEDPALLTQDRVKQFFLHCIREQKCAPTTLRITRVSLGAFYNGMMELDWKMFASIHAKDERKLPVVMSREEVLLLLNAVRQPRFGVCIRLIYECGLRMSEALRIDITCIDAPRGLLHVKGGKGQKDRMIPISPSMVYQLRWWWSQHRNQRLLFPSMGKRCKVSGRAQASVQWASQMEMMKVATQPMSGSCLQQAFRKVADGLNLNKHVTIHTLRHSYATHLLEMGISIRLISQYLGHASLEQTLVYTHLTQVTDDQTQQALAKLTQGLPFYNKPVQD